MKLLFTNLHNTDGGGHVTYILGLAKELSRSHQVSVAVPGSSRLYRYAQQIPTLKVIDQRYSSRLLRMIPEIRQLRRLLAHEQYDVVHVNGSADHRHVMLARQGLRKPPKVVWTKHNDHPVSSFGHRLRARWATDHAIAVSAYIRGMLAESPYAVRPQSTIRHGIDTSYFYPPDHDEKQRQRHALFGPDHEKLMVFGSTGGTDYEKGWLDLLTAVAQLPEAQKKRCRVIVAGAPLRQGMRDRVDRLGVSDLAIFPGLIDDVRPVLAACDVGFVLSYREALSYACREAMATGLPTLVSNVGGLPENIEDGVDGWVVSPKAPSEIVDVISSLFAQPDRLKVMGAAARKKSELDFAMPLFVERTGLVYKQVIGGVSDSTP